jgi:protein TonB
VEQLPPRELFTEFVVSGPSGPRRSRLGALVSFAVHGALAFVLLLVPLFWGEDFPAAGAYQLVMLNPPPPPPPPLSLGSEKAKPQPEQKRQPETEPEKATPIPVTEFVAPREEEPIKPDPSIAQPEDAGSLDGVAEGDPEGMIDGIAGGTIGGVPNGVLGGVIGGTGIVADYDQPPRPVRITKPVYTQEGFIKKIEGTVVLEIVIDVTGRVVRHRIIESIPALDRAAVACVYQWVFVPAIKHGRPVATLATAPVNFRIH